MAGAEIKNSDDFLVLSNAGKQHAMCEGSMVVHDSTCVRIGERTRRDMITIFAYKDKFRATQMLAATIINSLKTVAYIYFDMKYGTMILVKKLRHLLATFRHCGLLKIEFLRLLFKQLALSCKPLEFFRGFGPEAIRYAGDTSCSGMGEILILKNARLPR